ncbi:MAG TPA: MMPL family transporter [Gammaproteobacteria bacterium]
MNPAGRQRTLGERLESRLERWVFGGRPWVIALFVVATLLLALSATRLQVDASYGKQLPLGHEYMRTLLEYQQEFGGTDRVLIALMARDGDIFTAPFFQTLREATDEVFFLPGVDRSRVRSLFTPNVRFVEVVAGGFAGGNVIPADFRPTPEGLARVRENVLKSGLVGRLVASDFSGAIVSAELLEIDPETGRPIDYAEVSRQLEEKIRARFESASVDVHIIGFAKVIGDITDGAHRVIQFFLIAFAVTALLAYLYTQSVALTVVLLGCSLIAVTWLLGLLPLAGFGMDPMTILVPFLVFAIGVSHGAQMVSSLVDEFQGGCDCEEAARRSFARLLPPGAVALVSDCIGFSAMLLIDIGLIQEVAITASIGVATIILTNLVLLPVLISYLRLDDGLRQRYRRRTAKALPFWSWLARITERRVAAWAIALAVGLFAVGFWLGGTAKIGDQQSGVPELRPESRYNRDSAVITERFAIGVDMLGVYVETEPSGCIDHEIMALIDRFDWTLANTPGVRSVVSMPGVAKVINAGWNEGSLKWRVLPRNQHSLVQATDAIKTDSGLLNADCSVMPVLVFTSDHKAETIRRVIDTVRTFEQRFGSERVRFRLAGGNVGVMAAANEAVEAAQFPMLFYVFSAIFLLCLLANRSLAGTISIVLPLGLVSLLAYALMNLLEIGLKSNTLPVVALGIGVGVDYGIYIYSRFQEQLRKGRHIRAAYRKTLAITGTGVLFTAVTLAIGVATWIFSPLQFQVDMGILLTFMFLVNMLGAMLLLPALVRWLLPLQAHLD